MALLLCAVCLEQWADVQNVFVLTRAGTLYHSNNGGHTLQSQMENMSEAT